VAQPLNAMFDTIILLAGEAEHDALPPLLRAHNPLLTVMSVTTAADLAGVSSDVLVRSRLIGYVTPEIVSKDVLDRLGYGALNFHPGPPRYPGWAPSHFALYEGATEFGATVHVMLERVDAGPIVGVASFPVPPDISVLDLEGMTYVHLAQLFRRMAKSLATDPQLPPALPIKWGGRRYSRRDYRALCDIPLDISKDELDRRLKIFGDNHFGLSPTVHLHGVAFRAMLPPAGHDAS
jgi:methionyl-tRNA formyltransferase